jgi:hypothetical protein
MKTAKKYLWPVASLLAMLSASFQSIYLFFASVVAASVAYFVDMRVHRQEMADLDKRLDSI